MVQKQSVHGRMAQLSIANLDAILDRAQDPARCITELIDAFSEVMAQAETLVEGNIGKLHLAEADHAEDVAASVEWEQEVRQTNTLAREASDADEQVRAQQLTSLATYAAGRQASFESWARQSAPHIAAQSARIKELRTVLGKLDHKLTLLKEREAEAGASVQGVATAASKQTQTSINVFDPTAELLRFRERVDEIQSNMG